MNDEMTDAFIKEYCEGYLMDMVETIVDELRNDYDALGLHRSDLEDRVIKTLKELGVYRK